MSNFFGERMAREDAYDSGYDAGYYVGKRDGYAEAINDISSVKHGKWEFGRCTNCNTPPDDFVSGDYWIDYKPNFCPNCGADMREEK